MADARDDDDKVTWTTRLVRWSGILLLALAAAVAVRGPSGPTVETGRPAPGLRLATLQGDTVDLAAHEGRPLLLNFFATWCAPCRLEIPVLNRLYGGLHGEVDVVGVLVFSGLPSAEQAAEVSGMKPAYPVWVSDDESAAAWRVSAVPVTVLLDRQRVVRAVFNGMVDEAEVRDAIRALP